MANEFFGKIGKGLAATRRVLSDGLQTLFAKKPQIDLQALDPLEALLLGADLGVEVTQRFLAGLRIAIEHQEATDLVAVKKKLKAYMVTVLQKGVAQPLPSTLPRVSLFVGVNGVGKTTTLGKRAHHLRREGQSVLLAAADTFRAGAIEQLKIWGERAGAGVICHAPGADPAAVVHDAVAAASARKVDHLLIDTAGRLQTQHNLMAELGKIRRVIAKGLPPDTPYERVLTLDATTGQNALSQARLFHKEIGVTSLILTKLDGTARGGILLSVVEATSAPVTHVGVGEGMDDLIPFDAHAFADALIAET